MKAGEEVFCSYDYKMDSAPPWYQELNAIRICKLYKKVKMLWNKAIYFDFQYTQYPIIRNGLIRNSAEFLWKFKKRALGESNLRNASKNLRNGQCSDFQS